MPPKTVAARIEARIHVIRGERVMLDSDLAALYGVPTKRVDEAVRRNQSRFPPDFMFRLNGAEAEILRSQTATSSSDGYGGRRYLPYAFTEHERAGAMQDRQLQLRQMRQEIAGYRIAHHTSADTLDMAHEPDLIQGAQVMAVTALRLANREEMLPRKR